MSVPKSRRGESPAEYINLAREIYVFTYNRVRILPKSYTFYFSLPLYNAAREAYRMIKTANLIYVDEKSPEEIRRRNIQRRKEYYETAQGYYNSIWSRASSGSIVNYSREGKLWNMSFIGALRPGASTEPLTSDTGRP